MSTKEKTDVFAQIAAQRVAYRDASLKAPTPPQLPPRDLPFESSAERTFQPMEKIETAAALQAELERQRRAHEPFFRDLAPALPVTRQGFNLEEFDWRKETEADRTNFRQTLDGAGAWERVRIPHYGEPLARAVTYYRTTFEVSAALRAAGRLFLSFKAVDYKAHVFVNDAFLGSHEGFFAPFEFDFTAHAREGTNVLLVKVENDAACMGNGSWGEDGDDFEGDKIYAATGPGYDEPVDGWHHCPPGMGIWQDVRVEARALLHVSDIFVRPLPDEGRAEAWIEVWNADRYRQTARVTLSVFGQNFEAAVFTDRPFDVPGKLGPGVNFLRFSFDLPEARLWELDTPWLYQAQVKLLDAEGRLLDAQARQFGQRSFRIDETSEPKGRIYLNNREIRLRGANTMGHEQQCVMKRDWNQLRDDFLLAKICNMNFLRITQRPVQPEIYDYCDRLGLMLQSDLPLFGVFRRNQFCEGVRQAGEMERLVRSHPCSILVSYTNEPVPASWGSSKPWRNLTRPELESFFVACDQAVRLANPDRAIKPVDGDYDPPAPGLPDNHCYCGWYTGHGVDLGRLHKGHWQPVKPGWMHACGEFGAEGLDPADLMRRLYPKSWMPASAEEEQTWTPHRIPKAQTGNMHYMWFDTQQGVENWVRTSQAHQAWVTRIMTEAFRRDSRMNSIAIHLFIDAFPSGWMKTIMDVERRPKPSYFVYRDALTPLMVNLRCDRRAFFAGEEMAVEAWICNDTQSVPEGATLRYWLEVDGKVTAAGTSPAAVARCDSAFQGFLRLPAPAVAQRGTATLHAGLLDREGRVLHSASLTADIFPQCQRAAERRVCALSAGGKAERLIRDLGLTPLAAEQVGDAEVILIDSIDAFNAQRAAVEAAVQRGARAIFLDLPARDTLQVAGTELAWRNCGMGWFTFVSRDTGHPAVAGFRPDDFKFWYDAQSDCPSPVIAATFEAPGWTPILKSGNGGWGTAWGPVLAAAERPEGAGRWIVCQALLAGRVKGNPVVEIFSRRLLGLE